MNDQDFNGCSRECGEGHTYGWGRCELGVQPMPTLRVSRTYTASDGELAGGFDTFPLALFLPWTVHLPVGEQHQMLAELADTPVQDQPSVLAAWAATADSLSDPTRRDVLFGKFGPADFAEAERPKPDLSGWNDGENAEWEARYGPEAAVRLRAANGRVWAIVRELREAAVAEGRDPYRDPMAQRLSAALVGVDAKGFCELPHMSVEEEDACDRRHYARGGVVSADALPILETGCTFPMPSRADVEAHSSLYAHADWDDTRAPRMRDPEAQAAYTAAEGRERHNPPGPSAV
jgi:hypothetical protein